MKRRGLAPDAGRVDVEERAPTDGDDRRVRADDEPVPGHGHHGLLQPDPDGGALAGRQLGAIQQEDARHDFRGSGVEADPVARLERPRSVAEQFQGSVDEPRGHQRARQPEHVAAVDRGALQPLQIHGRPLARHRPLDRAAVDLQTPDLGLYASGKHLDPVVDLQLPGGQRARHHGPEAPDGEHTIDGEPGQLIGRARRDRRGESPQGRPQLAEPLARLRRDRQHGRALQERPPDETAHVVGHQLEPVTLDHVDLGQGHEPRPDAQERADGEVLAGLRHDALVGGHDQQRQVDAPHPGQHVLHEALMAGHIHDLDGQPIGLLEEGEPQIDGDPARLLLRQAVGVDAGERLDQRGLSVVDVAGGADDDVVSAHQREAARASAMASGGISEGRIVRQSRRSRSLTTRAMTGGSPVRSAVSRSRV